MKRFLVTVLVLAGSFLAAAQTPPKDTVKTTYIRAGHLFDATSDTVRENVVIVVTGDRIQNVASAASFKRYPLAPAESALRTYAGSSCIDSINKGECSTLLGNEPPKQDNAVGLAAAHCSSFLSATLDSDLLGLLPSDGTPLCTLHLLEVRFSSPPCSLGSL